MASKSLEINTSYPDSVTDQRMVFTDGEKIIDTSLSMLTVPSTKEAYPEDAEPTGRPVQDYFDINELRNNNPEAIAKIDAELQTPIILEAEDGSKLDIRIANSGAKNEDGTEAESIAIMTSWSTDSEWDSTRGMVEAFALNYPDKKIVYINMPEDLSKARQKEMKKTGSFMPLADHIKACLDSWGEPLKITSAFGPSLGGRGVIALSAAVGAKFVVSVDAPGTHDQSKTGFAVDFMGSGKHAVAINEHSPDKPMVEAHKNIDSKRLGKDILGEAKRLKFKKLGRLLLEAWTMRKAGLMKDIDIAIAAGTEVYDIRYDASEISDYRVAVEHAKEHEGHIVIVTKEGKLATHPLIDIHSFANVTNYEQMKDIYNSRH